MWNFVGKGSQQAVLRDSTNTRQRHQWQVIIVLTTLVALARTVSISKTNKIQIYFWHVMAESHYSVQKTSRTLTQEAAATMVKNSQTDEAVHLLKNIVQGSTPTKHGMVQSSVLHQLQQLPVTDKVFLQRNSAASKQEQCKQKIDFKSQQTSQ